MQIGMWSDKMSIEDLTTIAYWKLRGRILQIDGVADVSIWNERQPTIQVRVDPDVMAADRVTLDSVERTTADALDTGILQFSSGAVTGAGGVIDTSTQRLKVAHELSMQSTRDLARTPLEEQPIPGRTLRLEDVADVVVAQQPTIGDAIINGKPGILLVVEKLPWGNTLSVTRDVENAVKDLQPGLPGINFDTHIFRPATFIEDSLSNLGTSMLIGFTLVVIVLALFLFEWRAALIALVTIPLSTAGAFLILHQAGVMTTTMVLVGFSIALGDNVDDSIIDVENILRRARIERAEGSTRPFKDIILDASVEIRNSIVFSTFIDCAAVLPVFLLAGLTAAFFQPLVLAYVLTILVSMVVSLTVVPAMTLLLMRRAHLERRHSPVADRLRAGYTAMLSRIIKRPVVVFATFGIVLCAGLALLPFLGESLFPAFKQRDLMMHFIAVPGTSDAEMARASTRLSDRLLAIKGIDSYGIHIGRALSSEEVAGIEFAEAWVSMDKSADYDATVAKVRGVLSTFPGFYTDVLTYLNERIEEVLAGSTKAITIRIYGQDLAEMRAKAAEVRDIVSDVPGTLDPNVDVSADAPQVQVEVNIAKARAYGLKPGDVRRAAAAIIAPLDVGSVFRKTLDFTVCVWSKPYARANATSIGNVLVDTPSGKKVRIADVADVAVRSDANILKRENGSRYIDVTTNVSDRDLGSVVADIRSRMKVVEFEQGAHFEILGEYQEREAAQSRLLTTALFALLLIFLLLLAALGSWRLAAMLLVTLPVALVGGLLGVWLSGGTITIGALVGLFTVFGLAQGNAILMINHFKHLEHEEGETFGPELVVRGARERLAPILMTSLCVGLALLPIAIGGDIPGHEIEYPLAMVIICGLFTSTLLTLLVLPSLYLRFGKRPPSAESE